MEGLFTFSALAGFAYDLVLGTVIFFGCLWRSIVLSSLATGEAVRAADCQRRAMDGDFHLCDSSAP